MLREEIDGNDEISVKHQNSTLNDEINSNSKDKNQKIRASFLLKSTLNICKIGLDIIQQMKMLYLLKRQPQNPQHNLNGKQINSNLMPKH